MTFEYIFDHSFVLNHKPRKVQTDNKEFMKNISEGPDNCNIFVINIYR